MSTLKICIRYNEWICFGHISNKIIFFFSWLHRIALYFVFVYISFLLFIESNLELLKKKGEYSCKQQISFQSSLEDLRFTLFFDFSCTVFSSPFSLYSFHDWFCYFLSKNAPCISPSLVDISASICFYYTALQESFASETDLSPTVTSPNVGSAYLFNINSYMNVTSTERIEKIAHCFSEKVKKNLNQKCSDIASVYRKNGKINLVFLSFPLTKGNQSKSCHFFFYSKHP